MSTALPGTRAVLFDMDGVLVDSTVAHLQAWSQFLDERDIAPPEGGIRSLFGRRASEAVTTLLGLDDVSPVARSALEDLERRADTLLETYAPGELLVAGAPRVVHLLSEAGLKLAVATSARRRAAEHSLGPLLDAFEIVVTAEDVTRGKPDPEVFLTAAAHLLVPSTACIVVEDAIAGVEAGKRAGMRVVAVIGTASVAQLRTAGADAVVDHVTDLPPLVLDSGRIAARPARDGHPATRSQKR